LNPKDEQVLKLTNDIIEENNKAEKVENQEE
jgi:hypothetical protein